MTSLNPLHTIEKQLREAVELHSAAYFSNISEYILELLTRVGIDRPRQRLSAYPHQLSGGQRQRVMIAMALANNPKILIADEPTTALSLIETQKVFDFVDNVKKSGRSVLFIGHNIYHVYDISDRFIVLDRGEVVHQLNKNDIEGPEALMKVMKDAVSKH